VKYATWLIAGLVGIVETAMAANVGKTEPDVPIAPAPETVPEEPVEEVLIFGVGGGHAVGSPAAAEKSFHGVVSADLSPPPEPDIPEGYAPTWSHTLGDGTFTVLPKMLTIDANGNTYITGATYGALTPGREDRDNGDAFVARVNAEGELDWIEQFGSEEWDGANAVLLSGESIIVAGTTKGDLFGELVLAQDTDSMFSWSPLDVWIAWYSLDGTLERSVQLGLPSQFAMGNLQLAPDAEGNLYVAFTTMGRLPGDEDLDETEGTRVNIGVVKCDPEGNVLWTKCVGRDNRDLAAAMLLGDDGTIYIIGQTDSEWTTPVEENDDGDVLIVALDASGTQLWAQQYTSGDYDAPQRAILDEANGRLYVTGYSQGDFAGELQGEYQGFLLALDTDGQWLWADPIHTDAYIMPTGLALDDEGNIVVIASVSSGNGTVPASAIRYDPTGARLSETPLGTGQQATYIRSIVIDDVTDTLHAVADTWTGTSVEQGATTMVFEYPFPDEAPEDESDTSEEISE
jgi:hypothetical protein